MNTNKDDEVVEGMNNLLQRDANNAETTFSPSTQVYRKDDVVQGILAKQKGGTKDTKPSPIRIPEPLPVFGDESPPTLASPKKPSDGIVFDNPRANVPNLSQSALARGYQSGGKMTRKNTTTGGDIVSVLLTIRNQVKLYHWQTKSYADHKATDDLTAALDIAIDTFVEVYMGKYGRPRVTKSMKLHNFSANMAREFVTKQTVYLLNVLPRKLKKTDTDLLNVRDEILAELNKIRYLFTLS